LKRVLDLVVWCCHGRARALRAPSNRARLLVRRFGFVSRRGHAAVDSVARTYELPITTVGQTSFGRLAVGRLENKVLIVHRILYDSDTV